ncbi:MAG: MDR family MFS transporter [Mycobacteriaceae bacterium]
MTAQAAARVDVGFRSERGPILIALMLCTGLVALDSTIIATAVPSIVDDLGGFSSFPWLFSTYLLAQAVSVPIYGKVADLYGRKPVMLFGIGLFLLGSVLCGFAWSMPALIVFRAVQGLGAGAVQPMSITIAGDIYTLAERAKAQGYLASVWGISAVVGPTLGGVFSEYVSWRWIFFVNIPLCLVAAVTLRRRLHEQVVRREHHIDKLGALLLTVGATLVVLGLLEGDEAWPWISWVSFAVLGGGLLLLVAFVVVEQRVPEPVLPLWVLRRRLLLVTSLVAAGVGAIVLGLTSYVPTFVQTVLGHGPLVAGFALATLTVGWPLAASQAGRLYLRYGFRVTALLGGVVAVLGTGLVATVSAQTSVWAIAAYCFVIGLGMGLVASPTLIAAQSSVGWSERGVVTGTNLFSRSLGSAVGIALFGAIVNASVRNGESAAAVELGSRHVFMAVAGLALVMTLGVLALPGRDRTPAADAPTA